MKIFVATSETQGERRSDFNSCDDGVIVLFAMECDGESIDGGCGCRRAMSGITSGATTTFKVADVGEMDEAQYRALILGHYREGGWLTRHDVGDDPEWVATFDGDTTELLRVAQTFPVGMVLEKRGNQIQERRKPQARRAS